MLKKKAFLKYLKSNSNDLPIPFIMVLAEQTLSSFKSIEFWLYPSSFLYHKFTSQAYKQVPAFENNRFSEK